MPVWEFIDWEIKSNTINLDQALNIQFSFIDEESKNNEREKLSFMI